MFCVLLSWVAVWFVGFSGGYFFSGCISPNWFPSGSDIRAIWPTFGIFWTGIRIFPPSSVAFIRYLSMFSTVM